MLGLSWQDLLSDNALMTKTVTDILKQLGEHTLHYSDQDEAYHVLKAALTAHEPTANPSALKCSTCKRPFEEVPTKGASTDPLACLHPVVMSNVGMDGSTNKWCYSCGAAL